MRRNFLKIFVLATLLSVYSCNDEDYLGFTPINEVAPEVAFSSPSLIESTMNGMYNAAQIGTYNGGAGRGYVWGAAYIQQNDCRGEDVVNTAAFYQITYTNIYTDVSPNNVNYWSEGYRLINRCNVIIEGLNDAKNKGVISNAVADNNIGEARFLRAITHFELLNHFARNYNFTSSASHPGIPYREIGVDTQAEIDSELLKGRNTVAECYDKILADLDFAEANITNTTKTKATKNAAIGFKTRVKLAKRDWNGVVTEFLKIQPSATLNVTATPKQSFSLSPGVQQNIEAMFYISNGSVAGTQNPGVNGAIGSQYNTRSLIAISPIIWRDPVWLSDDKRREEGVLVRTLSSGTAIGKYTNKYTDTSTYTDATPILRYAEVLLNVAEAYARLGNTTAALTNLNLVRNRSLATPATQAYTATSFADATAMVGAILKERRIEFICEGKRWGDIHRLQNDDLFPINGIPAKVSNGNVNVNLYSTTLTPSLTLGVATVPSADKLILWPIPLNETNINPTLKAQQNPGW